MCVEPGKAFHGLKKEIENSFFQGIDKSLPFKLKCDDFYIALAALLNEASRLAAFFLRTLHGSELKRLPVMKEACANIELIRKHYLNTI